MLLCLPDSCWFSFEEKVVVEETKKVFQTAETIQCERHNSTIKLKEHETGQTVLKKSVERFFHIKPLEYL